MKVLTSLIEEIDSNITVAGDFNTPLTTMDRSSIQKFSKKTLWEKL